jgi:hypothetical protein
MSLLPDTTSSDTGNAIAIATQESYPNKTYKMQIDSEHIAGTITDALQAVEQAVYKILNTERYKHVIYSWNYGVELEELFGKPMPYVLPEIPRRIREALIQDDRINDVVDFDLSYTNDGSVLAKFTVETIYGELQAEKAVKVS